MAAKKRTPDAARVEQFLDDLRSRMPSNPLPKTTLQRFLASLTELLVQAVLFGTTIGIGLRIVRFIAGF